MAKPVPAAIERTARSLKSGTGVLMAGEATACVLLGADRELACWGVAATRGKVATHRPTRVGIAHVKQVVMGRYYDACVLADDGVVRCWKVETDTRGKPQPRGPLVKSEQLSGAIHISNRLGGSWTPYFAGWSEAGRPLQGLIYDGLPPVLNAQAGSDHACLLVQGGQVFCQGDHELGQRPKPRDCTDGMRMQKDQDGCRRLMPRDPRPPRDPGPCESDPNPIAAVTGATQISVAHDVSCAVTVDHKVMCWGTMYWPIGWMLLPGATYPKVAPLKGFGQAVQVGVSQSHICVLDVTGAIRCLGSNGVGQLGDGSTRTTVNPVRVSGIDDAIEIAVGAAFTCAVRQDRSLWCWGSNVNGTLGVGGSTELNWSVVPVQTLPPGSVSERRDAE